jgi:hypothetical protein
VFPAAPPPSARRGFTASASGTLELITAVVMPQIRVCSWSPVSVPSLAPFFRSLALRSCPRYGLSSCFFCFLFFLRYYGLC